MDKENLIKKWLSDELTTEEWEAFRRLDDYKSHVKILEGAQNFKASEVSEVASLDDLYAKLDKQQISSFKEKDSNTWYKPLLRIAAILVLLLGIGSFFFMDNGTRNFETLISEKTSVALPDASTVMLNSKSKIAFNEDKWGDKREVVLDGEAFFKVAKGSKFDVVAGTGIVSVKGTQFNVKNRKGYFEVKCFEGLVNVQYNGQNKDLPAGSTLKIVNGTMTSDMTSDIFPNWLNNISSFKSVPLYEVINEFERQYDVVFSLENIDTSRIFTGGFVHTNLEDALKSITLPLDFTYNIDSDNHIRLYKK
ncbi:FecR family protein [Aquimarina sp. AD10]|uniref:Anti-sigma factor n=1 Tax=Aquimarina aggregata TaxID=1642818 RepID=A0A163A7Z4_9FLAO|nr:MULTISPECIES: FecR family protein [Aquimarina]AXT63338.1 FecR family protein [Aquimarina sp. AD10]KZS40331.1 hypothetical protein AWE51_05085 [Aquimarina aggregata]RKN00649.1 FecR family protein [Aquimarina sp. AD10]